MEIQRIAGIRERSRLSLVVCIILVCLSATCKLTAQDDRASGGQATGLSGPGTFFFGKSHDANLGELAWLFYLDSSHRSGQMLIAPRMVTFSDCEWGVDGSIRFQLPEFLGRAYRFNGTLQPSTLKGHLQLVNARTGKSMGDWQLLATSVSLVKHESDAEPSTLIGRFTNEGYSEKGGDQTGVDVRLFSTKGEPAGMIIFYESYWGEPTFIPLALSHVLRENQTIHFETDMPSGLAHYRLLLTQSGGLLSRDDVSRAEGVSLERGKFVF